MELYELEAFVAVAAQRSFTRAAEQLFLTQPAVTRQVAALEAERHARLFDRLGRTVRLTVAGEALHRYAVEMLRLAAEAERAVGDVVTGEAGRLSVGANSTTATYILPPVLRRFRETYPGIDLSVRTGVSARVMEMVLNSEVELGVVSQFGEPSGLIEIPLSAYQTVVVVYPGHPLAGSRASGTDSDGIQAADLVGNPLILMEQGTNLRAYVDRLLTEAGVDRRAAMELDNVEAIKKMIEARLGISLLPLVSVGAEVAGGRLIALPLAGPVTAQRRIAAVYRPDCYVSVALAAFLGMLKENAGIEASASRAPV